LHRENSQLFAALCYDRRAQAKTDGDCPSGRIEYASNTLPRNLVNSFPSYRTGIRAAALGLALAASLLPLRTAHAQATGNIISYQGKATDANGAALTGTQTIVFNIYKDGPSVFTETAQATLSGGVFNVFLNIGTLEFDPEARYEIGIKVGAGAEVKHPIAAVPVAVDARGLQGKAVSETDPIDGQALRFNGATGKWEPATGAIGPQGPQGVKGDTGDTGPQGAPGQPGTKGDTGETGPQGIKGDTGDSGPQGAPGQPGVKGDTGETGAQGIKGDTGTQGIQARQEQPDLKAI
jgi:hypothetical protein